jgi:hypothetical protein
VSDVLFCIVTEVLPRGGHLHFASAGFRCLRAWKPASLNVCANQERIVTARADVGLFLYVDAAGHL